MRQEIAAYFLSSYNKLNTTYGAPLCVKTNKNNIYSSILSLALFTGDKVQNRRLDLIPHLSGNV